MAGPARIGCHGYSPETEFLFFGTIIENGNPLIDWKFVQHCVQWMHTTERKKSVNWLSVVIVDQGDLLDPCAPLTLTVGLQNIDL